MAPPPLLLLEEGTGESSSPPRDATKSPHSDLRRKIYEKLVKAGKQGGLDDSSFREMLYNHFDKLPRRYLIDLGEKKAEDVLLHRSVLQECALPGSSGAVIRARFLECIPDKSDCEGTNPESDQCQKLEDLTLEKKHGADNTGSVSASSRDSNHKLVHEIIFSCVDRPKLLSQLTALLSEIGLNIREAHVYSTTDGFCLDVFVVEGWMTERTDELIARLKDKLMQQNGAPSSSTDSSSSVKIRELRQQVGDSEIDWSMVEKGERIASGSTADLYRGTYKGSDVAIKMLRVAHLNNASEVEFLQEVLILRSVNHENILQFYGASTRHPNCCIVTEYMPEGNLYEFLHKQNDLLEINEILRIAISISKGMEYLHRNNIIHRDLKTANVLKGYGQVLKIADFGVSRIGSQEGQMTAETGTYRWMAPEIIDHKPYDHKADVFSFAIVLWELITLKVPYDDMTPLQAALGVRQIPSGTHPGLSKLIRQCWDEDPEIRPAFGEIITQLEDMLQQVPVETPKGGHHRRYRAKKIQKKS
ncbi:hypothetical protein BRADI_3g13060v3 [Brachypodium distachyon]|uniref:non-specific serine/threonine protein kinase n=1 Tax=Brachypodium distachyon TaxID=15368 RepID=A0A0Q3HMZ5_BRADI|nr:hypothetical protein BRADI_3g13060v3 [Brachypodium distachyon]